MKKLALLFCLSLLSVCAQAQANKNPTVAAEIKNIDTYTKKIDAYVKLHKNPQLVFADTASQTSTRAKWKQFASEKALDQFREKSETYEIAYCWKQSGRVAQVSTTLFSGSGDWVNYIYHYFRADGSLAKVESDFRSFYGDLIVEQSIYFDTKGKQLKKTTNYRDLKTKKFKKVDPKSDPISLSKFEIYKTVKKLPFAHLLPQGKTRS
jgi:hypothetical protein